MFAVVVVALLSGVLTTAVIISRVAGRLNYLTRANARNLTPRW
ncbi:MAG: hypothetical protein U0792_14345 [Gemmataceae bacterium]